MRRDRETKKEEPNNLFHFIHIKEEEEKKNN